MVQLQLDCTIETHSLLQDPPPEILEEILENTRVYTWNLSKNSSEYEYSEKRYSSTEILGQITGSVESVCQM